MRFSHQFEYLSTNWKLLCKRVKRKPCRFCYKRGHIKNHGFLKGVHPIEPCQELRGIRFLCSNRYSNRGCGKSFSTLFSQMLPNHTTRSEHLKVFCDLLLKLKNVHAAWYRSAVPFSLRTAYRWLRKIKNSQAIIRSNIQTVPKDHMEKELATYLTTIRLMKQRHQYAEDYISSYQQQYQTSIFFSSQSTFSS